MGKIILLFILITATGACKNPIKNRENPVEIESGTDTSTSENLKVDESPVQSILEIGQDARISSLLGFWVGYFEKDTENEIQDKNLYVDEGYFWNRENKINISIDEIKDSLVIGHSVVAGNVRPFKGILKQIEDSNAEDVVFEFEVREPGDDKYDGQFNFKIIDNQLIGTWSAYKNIEIKNRIYTLDKKEFKYDPNIGLERAKLYVNWEKSKSYTEKVEYEENVYEEWIVNEFSTSTENIYNINASADLLKKKDVENLKKGDLTIIRNTIYARHGYSFKNRPLRVFFDAQNWYIPVHADIREDFTEIEKSNIKLLLSFEKNAAEYYDSFGRG